RPLHLFSTSFLFFFFYRSRDLRDLHSFPTRRSSDLAGRHIESEAVPHYGTIWGSTSGCWIVNLAIVNRPAQPIYAGRRAQVEKVDRKSTRLNSSHRTISYAVFCLKKKKKTTKNEE